MLKYLLLSVAVLFRTLLFSQEIFQGNHGELDVYIKLRQLPSIDIINTKGEKFRLDKYVETNIRHADKPFLMLLWGNGEPTGAKSLGDLAKAGIADQYNIISIYIAYTLESADRMNEAVGKATEGISTDKILFVAADFKDVFAKFYIPHYPMHIYANRYIRNLYPENVQPVASAKKMLDNLDGGLVQGDKVWHSKEGFITNEKDSDASFYTRFLFWHQGARYIKGTKDTVLTKVSYDLSGADYLYEGEFVRRTDQGNLTASGNFKKGIPTETFKTWYDDGKLHSEYPVSGTYKIYDETGKRVFDGPVVKGLGNGIFAQYVNGKPAAKSIYKNGVRSGLQQMLTENGTLLEWFATSGYEFEGYLKEGLQKIRKEKLIGFADRTGKIIIPFQFTSADDFKNGVANVSTEAEYFTIDKKGSRIKK